MQRVSKSIIPVLVICVTLPGWAGNDFSNTQVTIYNDNLGLVYQEKTVTLDKGENQIRIEGVSKQVQPATVKITFPKIANKYRIMEQNYLYDLVSTSKIFDKYTGENVTFRLDSGEKISGTLMNTERNYVIMRLANDAIRIITTDNIIDYEFLALPGGLILKPTLEWQIESFYKGNTNAQISYLSDGFSWNAEYVLVLDKNEKDFSLNSWISLNNRSGTTFENAKVKLIAGDINRTATFQNEMTVAAFRIDGIAQSKKSVETREIADYHLYELPGLVTLRNSELKQVSLFDEIYGIGSKIYQYNNYAGDETNQPLRVIYRIYNTKENNMGMALPKGTVRLFQRDTDESLQFIGEDRIKHTSNKDSLELTIGNAFDVKGKRTVMERDRSITNSETLTIKIEITNRKNSPIEVEIIENLSGYWNIRKSSHEYQQMSSNRIMFPLAIKADTVEIITYTYTRKW